MADILLKTLYNIWLFASENAQYIQLHKNKRLHMQQHSINNRMIYILNENQRQKTCMKNVNYFFINTKLFFSLI